MSKTLCVVLPRGKANVALVPRGAMKIRSQSLARGPDDCRGRGLVHNDHALIENAERFWLRSR